MIKVLYEDVTKRVWVAAQAVRTAGEPVDIMAAADEADLPIVDADPSKDPTARAIVLVLNSQQQLPDFGASCADILGKFRALERLAISRRLAPH